MLDTRCCTYHLVSLQREQCRVEGRGGDLHAFHVHLAEHYIFSSYEVCSDIFTEERAISPPRQSNKGYLFLHVFPERKKNSLVIVDSQSAL